MKLLSHGRRSTFPERGSMGSAAKSESGQNTGFHDCSARDEAVIGPSTLLQLHKQAAEVQLVGRLTLSHAISPGVIPGQYLGRLFSCSFSVVQPKRVAAERAQDSSMAEESSSNFTTGK